MSDSQNETNKQTNAPEKKSLGKTRRTFLKGTTAATIAASLPLARVAHAQGSGTIKVGLIGCGGRGTGAAAQAMNADKGVRLHAMGELFPDRLETSLKNLKAQKTKEQVDVPQSRKFSGFDSYKQVISECDLVILTTSPHFRPMMVEEAANQGKHMFIEKPVATDPVNALKCWESAKKARDKGLAVVSGLCYRYHKQKQEIMKRIHDGEIGDIVGLHTYYYTTELWHRGTKEEHPEWSEMEYQIRNWLYFTWLSGDHIVEQHIHSLDKCAWALQDKTPISAMATGGRVKRTDPKYGNIYDHFHVKFEYENNLTLQATCRQMNGTTTDIQDYVIGTKGVANLQYHYIKPHDGGKMWRGRRIKGDNMYQNEHDELFKSIRAGKPIYNGDYMCTSTLMAILGREAAYTGKRVKWEELLNSKQDLSPKGGYEFGKNPVEGVRVPGVSKLA